MVLFGVHAHQAKQGRAGQRQGRGRGRAKNNVKPQGTSQICADQVKDRALHVHFKRLDSSDSVTTVAPTF